MKFKRTHGALQHCKSPKTASVNEVKVLRFLSSEDIRFPPGSFQSHFVYMHKEFLLTLLVFWWLLSQYSKCEDSKSPWDIRKSPWNHFLLTRDVSLPERLIIQSSRRGKGENGTAAALGETGTYCISHIWGYKAAFKTAAFLLHGRIYTKDQNHFKAKWGLVEFHLSLVHKLPNL